MPSAHVLSVQALEELKVALTRFGAEAIAVLNSMEVEVRRTMDWLQERHNFWRSEVRRRQEILAQAERALIACRASGYRDPNTGVYHEPACTAQWEAVHNAKRFLAEAEAELRTVKEWTNRVHQVASDYERQAQRLQAWMNGELPKANAFLENKISNLQSYVAMDVPSVRSVTTPPIQAACEIYATAVGLASLGIDVSAVAIAVINRLAGDVRHVLGDVGEMLSARLLRERFELQEVPFDQPKHGFDRVFTAPGLPLIVMESKVTSTGAFHPGQTQHGEQGSPEWIAAQAEKMADPSSAQWSPTNERIAALIRDIGPDNIPAVAVVIHSETGLADVYVRASGSEGWELLKEGTSLSEALAGTRLGTIHPDTAKK